MCRNKRTIQTWRGGYEAGKLRATCADEQNGKEEGRNTGKKGMYASYHRRLNELLVLGVGSGGCTRTTSWEKQKIVYTLPQITDTVVF